MRASIVFHVKIKIEEVTKKNSGVHEFDNQSAKKVIDRINGLWNSLNNWINEPSKNRMRKSILLSFGTRTFLATPYNISKPIQFNKTGYDDEVIKKELKVLHYEYKMPLIDLIKDFYTAQYNPNMQFDKHLLEELGFVPCQTCA